MASKSSTSKKSSSSRGKKDAPKPIRREVCGAVCLFAAIFTFIGYFKDGYWLIDALSLFVFKGLFGWGFWIVPPVLLAASYVLFFHHGNPVGARLAALFAMPLILGAIVHMIRCGSEYAMQYTRALEYYSTGMALESGGLISSYVSELLRQAVSPYGALPLLIFLFLFCLVIAAHVSLKELLTPRPRVAYEPQPEPQVVRARVQPKAEQLSLPAIFAEPEKPSRRRSAPRPIDIPLDEPESVPTAEELPPPVYAEPEKPAKTSRRRKKKEEAVEEPAAPVEDIPPMPLGYAAMGKLVAAGAADELLSELTAEAADDTIAPDFPEVVDLLPPLEDEPPGKISKKEVRQATREVAQEIEELNEERPETYVYPPLELLNQADSGRVDGREEAKLNRERLEATLRSFGIRANITGITRGPSVTRYDLELEAGLRLTKLTNLAGDLALSLGVANVRIAPIPGRVATVGVEVPNKLVSTVVLREVVASEPFQKAPSTLTFAIGKDISGNCITGNISKLPHMLIAGTTGSGKSVCMNSLILSLLYKSSPDEVRLIMIDPKMVELGIYNGIPHLYIPVVTDPKKAAGSLQWSVVEMMKRYRLFSEIGVRDLKGYNDHQKKAGLEPLPSLVIVIDELADLMMTAAKEVEESICRVAQMGRAAGVHLIIATQRPSADVITGLMKANIPSRIAFSVSSAMESRIILDQPGAEKLIGNGDMLFFPIGSNKPMRVQGAYVSDEERERVIDFIKAGGEARYDENAIHDIEKNAAEKEKGREKGAASLEGEDASYEDNPFADFDELLPQAVDVILDTKQASVSMLQRRLKLGYARAARLVDQMEELGIVGPFEGSKPRQLLIDRQQWQEMSLAGRTPLEKLMDEQKDDFTEDESHE